MGYSKIEPGMTQKGDKSVTRHFTEPEQLWDAFREYVDDLNKAQEDGEWKKIHFVGKDGVERHEKQIIPMTQAGFIAYYWRKHKKNLSNYMSNHLGLYEDFKEVVQMIKDTIRDKQIVGGMLGHYNSSITARLNSLHDNQNVNHNGIDKIEIEIVK